MEHTKGEWKAYGAFVETDKTPICSTRNVNNLPIGEATANAHLIVVAVNACQSVNPDNPIAVAESIQGMYEALKVAETRIHNEIRYHPEPGSYRQILQDELRIISQALAKAEGK